MIQIELTQGKVAIVDDIDSDLNNFKWCYNNGYAMRRNANERPTQLRMHRIILERILGRVLTGKEEVDHVNGDRLDNRRDNLRLATRSENMRNRSTNGNNISGLKGVSWHKHVNKWQAQIRIYGKNKNLGYFDSAELAHEAYKQAAIKHYGEFARFE